MGIALFCPIPSMIPFEVWTTLCQIRSSEVRFIDGCYTPLAIERLCEEIADSGGSNLSRDVFEAR